MWIVYFAALYQGSHTVPPRSAAARAPVPMADHCCPVPLQETLRSSEAGLAQSPWRLWVLVHTNFCLCPPRVFPQCCGSSVVKSHRPSKSNPLVVLSTFARSPVGESLWTVDLLQQWKNFLGVTVLQFVGCLLDHSMVGNTV